MKKIVFVLSLVLVFGLSEVFAQNVGVSVQPKAAIAEAKSPTPTAKASKKTSTGKGKATVNTANAQGDDDSFWVEEIDIDGDGTAEETDILYDDEDKVLLLFAEGDFKCANGGVGAGSILIAVNMTGNSRNRPAGSGWYVVALDEDECKAEAAGLYGCKFDANGNATACGLVTVDEKNDDIVIVEASK